MIGVRTVRPERTPYRQPLHVISRPVHVVTPPVHVVTRPLHVITRPLHVITRPLHVITGLDPVMTWRGRVRHLMAGSGAPAMTLKGQ
jgi:hypothetical protein